MVGKVYSVIPDDAPEQTAQASNCGLNIGIARLNKALFDLHCSDCVWIASTKVYANVRSWTSTWRPPHCQSLIRLVRRCGRRDATVYCGLHQGPVGSPDKAVRAAIVQETSEGKWSKYLATMMMAMRDGPQ